MPVAINSTIAFDKVSKDVYKIQQNREKDTLMLDSQTISIVKQTAPILAPKAEELTRLFYKQLFENNPEVKPYFNQAHQFSGGQQRALAGAIVAYATHIDQLDQLGSHVDLIAHKHVSLGIEPEHYPIVGQNLLAAIKELLGEQASDQVIDAWAKAYGLLAQIMIDHEKGIYQKHDQDHGGRGFREFYVIDKVVESDEITSFYLKPSDGSVPSPHLAGQYITLRLAFEGQTTMRNYSLSCAPGSSAYRISVKRETAREGHIPDGVVSNHLHDCIQVGDQLEVAPACGNFTLTTDRQVNRPLVLLSGGVGVTPVLSMLHAAVKQQDAGDIWFIHAARNTSVHAFDQEVRQLAEKHSNLNMLFCYDEPAGSDRPHCQHGRIDQALLKQLLPGADADFYFCGPKPFMKSIYRALNDWGVPEEQIHFEFFGPVDDLKN